MVAPGLRTPSRTSSEASRTAPRRATKPPPDVPAGSREASTGRKSDPERPRRPQDGPRSLQDAPKGRREASLKGPKSDMRCIQRGFWKDFRQTLPGDPRRPQGPEGRTPVAGSPTGERHGGIQQGHWMRNILLRGQTLAHPFLYRVRYHLDQSSMSPCYWRPWARAPQLHLAMSPWRGRPR